MAAISTLIAGVSALTGIGTAAAAKKQQKASAAAAMQQAEQAAMNAKKQEAAALKRQEEQREAAKLAAQPVLGQKATVVLGSTQLEDTALTAANKRNVGVGKKKKGKSKTGVGGLFQDPTNIGGL